MFAISRLEEDLAKVSARIDEINAEIVDRETKIATPGLKKGEVNFHVGKVTSLREELKDCEENQKNISIDSWSKLRTNKLSYLLQDLRLFNHLSVWDNLTLKNNLTNHKTAAQIEEMLEELR